MQSGLAKLSFHKVEHRDLLKKTMDKVSQDVMDLINACIVALSQSDPSLSFKVISLGSKAGIHIGYEKQSYDVVAWIDPCTKWINLRLRHGTHIDDLWPDVSHQARSSTPHTVVAKRIDQMAAVPKVVEMVKRSGYRQ